MFSGVFETGTRLVLGHKRNHLPNPHKNCTADLLPINIDYPLGFVFLINLQLPPEWPILDSIFETIFIWHNIMRNLLWIFSETDHPSLDYGHNIGKTSIFFRKQERLIWIIDTINGYTLGKSFINLILHHRYIYFITKLSIIILSLSVILSIPNNLLTTPHTETKYSIWIKPHSKNYTFTKWSSKLETFSSQIFRQHQRPVFEITLSYIWEICITNLNKWHIWPLLWN